MQLRIATCTPLPEPDPDEPLLLEASRARGIEARMAAWNDPEEDWREPVPTVIRSTWDYIHDLPRFLTWLDEVERHAPLWNPARIVRWNAHKGYLAELERSGHPVTPTVLLERGSNVLLAKIARERGWNDLVVKPAVSAASFGTRRFGPGDLREGEHHLATLLLDRDVLIQPYVASVDTWGERAIVWIDGELTHAVRKTPRFTEQEEEVSPAIAIEPDEREVAEAVLAPFASELLYARVDLARDEMGKPMIMELELIEPSLFLRQSEPALQRLSDGLLRRLR